MWLFYVIALPISIFIHELAHLVAAKLAGCVVEKFSIGFGRSLAERKIGQTTYQIAPILLGGYCKLKGELEVSPDPSAFCNLTYRKKVLISLAGVIVNLVVGTVCLIIGLRSGYVSYLVQFGFLNQILGITNAIPFPALDGSYPILVLLEKLLGKEKGYKVMKIICIIGFNLIMTLNIVSIVWLCFNGNLVKSLISKLLFYL